MKIVINPKYKKLESFIHSLPATFDEEGEIVQDARNRIKKLSIQGYNLNIKRFRKPIFINRIIYSFFRKPKAYKAYYNALRVIEKGLSTPAPIAYIEEYKNGLISYSYFISIQLEDVEEIRNFYFSKLETSEEEDFLKAFAIYSAEMHNKGVLHKDYSPGNVLYSKQEDNTYSFSIVDINRMKFMDIDIHNGCKNFARLFENDCVYEFIAPFYAQQREYDTEQCKKFLVEEKMKFHAGKYRKKRLKNLFKF